MKIKLGNMTGAAAAALAIAVSGSAASAATILVDDFSSNSTAAYTQTTVLDNDTTRNTTFSAAGGSLSATASTTSQAEQNLFLRSDFSLGINQQLRVDVTGFGTGHSQDFGLAVAATATPTAVGAGVVGDTRATGGGKYVQTGIRTDAGHAVSSGFDAAALATNQDQTNNGNAITSLFITRTSASTFVVGFAKDAGDVTLGTYTFAGTTTGTAIGFYTDMRAANTMGTFDNLRIVDVPEPASLALLGLGGLTALRRRRSV